MRRHRADITIILWLRSAHDKADEEFDIDAEQDNAIETLAEVWLVTTLILLTWVTTVL